MMSYLSPGLYLEGEGDIGALKTTCEIMLQEFVESLIEPIS